MDKKYWMEYYRTNNVPNQPSDFAIYIAKMLKSNKKMIELGCGNGRDSIFFFNKGISVTAIDQAENSMNDLNKKYLDIKFIADDFVNTNQLDNYRYDYIYSRFSMHSITLEEEDILLKRAYKALNKGGKIFIEARSIKDEFYGRGISIGKHEYIYEGHYRRFIDKNEIENKMKKIGYNIEFSIEDKDLAIYKNQNPVVLRIIASK